MNYTATASRLPGRQLANFNIPHPDFCATPQGSWDQYLARAGINGVEGMTISEISATVAVGASEKAFAPSLSLALETGQPWILPVGVLGTWAVTYLAVDVALTYVFDNLNSELAPGLGY